MQKLEWVSSPLTDLHASAVRVRAIHHAGRELRAGDERGPQRTAPEALDPIGGVLDQRRPEAHVRRTELIERTALAATFRRRIGELHELEGHAGRADAERTKTGVL